MKRRNADCGKIRRPLKRNKIAEGMYGSNTILYMKFLILWAFVIAADFMFMFRFEFLWPFWLLLRSVHDSFKYKGLAFSVLFVCIAITSDLVCLFFIPVHWLLFAASTYVWVQYVWHTDKGICLPTIILWMIFVYLEAAIRWKDSRHLPHLDLCRPFAAHCIGYPVVTLGFGFKSYVGYRMRQRKQREVAKENEFYMQLLQQALPQDESPEETQSTVANGTVPSHSLSVAQTVQGNSVANDHNYSSTHNEDRNLHTLSNPVTSSQSIQTAIQQHTYNNNQHTNINNSNNSSSNNRNVQTSSKINNGNVSTTSMNGHATTSLNGLTTSKIHRRSMEKEKNEFGHISNNTYIANNNNRTINTSTTAASDVFTSNGPSSSRITNLFSQSNQQKDATHTKDKENNNWDSSTSSSSFSSCSSFSNNSSSGKENHKTYANVNTYETPHVNGGHHSSSTDKKSMQNGNLTQYDVEEITEPTEKIKGRRNRTKKDSNISSKDNHHNSNSNSTTTHQQHSMSNHHNNHHNHNHQIQQKDQNITLESATPSTSSSSITITHVASQIVTKICETCLRLEAEIKKYRTEISHMKQIEHELRQKIEVNASTKSFLQNKQREIDELEKRLQDLSNARQLDIVNSQNTERRLCEERRQRQSLEAQLNNEKKARKVAEDKATRLECTESCKQRKQQIESESKQLRRELKALEEAKQAAEQQSRKYEQELRMFEAEVRNREAHQGTEVLMSALAAMQDKNSTLEKNLSAETRVKLDLFSALGEAKRQLEIKDTMVRNKDEEVLDLKAKIAQLLAVMPTDSLCLPQCSTTGSSMLRMNDTPPLQGPSSPMIGLGPTHQQMIAAHQLNSRSGSSVASSASSSATNVPTSSVGNVSVNNVVTQTSSNLDPNATAYTPKSSSLVGGAEA